MKRKDILRKYVFKRPSKSFEDWLKELEQVSKKKRPVQYVEGYDVNPYSKTAPTKYDVKVPQPYEDYKYRTNNYVYNPKEVAQIIGGAGAENPIGGEAVNIVNPTQQQILNQAQNQVEREAIALAPAVTQPLTGVLGFFDLYPQGYRFRASSPYDLTGQCAWFAEQLTRLPSGGKWTIGNTVNDKIRNFEKYRKAGLGFKVGEGIGDLGNSIIFNYGKYGHVGVITEVLYINGKPYYRITESNLHGDLSVTHDRVVRADDPHIIGILKTTPVEGVQVKGSNSAPRPVIVKDTSIKPGTNVVGHQESTRPVEMNIEEEKKKEIEQRGAENSPIAKALFSSTASPRAASNPKKNLITSSEEKVSDVIADTKPFEQATDFLASRYSGLTNQDLKEEYLARQNLENRGGGWNFLKYNFISAIDALQPTYTRFGVTPYVAGDEEQARKELNEALNKIEEENKIKHDYGWTELMRALLLEKDKEKKKELLKKAASNFAKEVLLEPAPKVALNIAGDLGAYAKDSKIVKGVKNLFNKNKQQPEVKNNFVVSALGSPEFTKKTLLEGKDFSTALNETVEDKIKTDTVAGILENKYGVKGLTQSLQKKSMQQLSQKPPETAEQISEKQSGVSSDVQYNQNAPEVTKPLADPFFRSGGAERYKNFLKPNAQQMYGGALRPGIFKEEFYQNPEFIKEVFGNTPYIGEATQRYKNYLKSQIVPGYDQPYRYEEQGDYVYQIPIEQYWKNKYYQDLLNKTPDVLSPGKFTYSQLATPTPLKRFEKMENKGMLVKQPLGVTSSEALKQVEKKPLLYQLPQSKRYKKPQTLADKTKIVDVVAPLASIVKQQKMSSKDIYAKPQPISIAMPGVSVRRKGSQSAPGGIISQIIQRTYGGSMPLTSQERRQHVLRNIIQGRNAIQDFYSISPRNYYRYNFGYMQFLPDSVKQEMIRRERLKAYYTNPMYGILHGMY